MWPEGIATRAIGLARALADPWRLTQILGQQAQAAFVAGDPPAACAAAEEGRDLADAIGDRFGSLQCRWRLRCAHMMKGYLPVAITQLRDMVADAEADHDLMSWVIGLLVLTDALAYHGETSAACAAAEMAIESAESLGDIYVGTTYAGLMIAHLAAGDIALASNAAEAAWARNSDLYGTAAINSIFMAHVALARGDLTAVRRAADDAIAATAGWYVASALTMRARIAMAEGDLEQAEPDAHDGLACSVGVKAYLGAGDNLEILAGLTRDADSQRESARLFWRSGGHPAARGRGAVPDLSSRLRGLGTVASKHDGKERL